MELKLCFSVQVFRCHKTFNRTAYGIEIEQEI